MTVNARVRRSTYNWCSVVPEVVAPIGGVLFKEVGHTSTWAAISVAAAPYTIAAIRYTIFLIGYVLIVIRYLCSGQARKDDIRDLITLSANALVSMQTLVPTENCISRTRGFSASKPELTVLAGGPESPSKQGK
jgi:hypothetical protein